MHDVQVVVSVWHVRQVLLQGSHAFVVGFSIYIPAGQFGKHEVPTKNLPEIQDRHCEADVQVTHGDTQPVHK